MSVAYLFPGQGAQKVGMGKDLYEAFPVAREIFDRAEEIVSLPLKKLCFEGPEDELARTDIGQPAIFTVSAATLAVMKDLLAADRVEVLEPTHLAGLSLGEYTALYAAGSMDFETAVNLVARRGEAMQEAAVAVESGMVSVIGLDEAEAEKLCLAAAQGEVLTCANFNCPGQIVLSGQIAACKRAAEMAKDFGASAAILLKVAGAFHSELMKPAVEKLAEALEQAMIKDPEIRLIANTDAQGYDHAGEVKDRLLAQLTSPIRWQESMEKMLADGVEKFYEIGPGRVLAGLMRRINRRSDFTCLNSREAIEKLVGA